MKTNNRPGMTEEQYAEFRALNQLFQENERAFRQFSSQKRAAIIADLKAEDEGHAAKIAAIRGVRLA